MVSKKTPAPEIPGGNLAQLKERKPSVQTKPKSDKYTCRRAYVSGGAGGKRAPPRLLRPTLRGVHAKPVPLLCFLQSRTFHLAPGRALQGGHRRRLGRSFRSNPTPGTPLATMDALIVATALEHDLTVATRNVKDLPGWVSRFSIIGKFKFAATPAHGLPFESPP
jgi:hypothetical protein